MYSAQEISTPIVTSITLDLNSKEIDLKFYRSIIGSLLYLTTSRSNIVFVVRLCLNTNHVQKKFHLVIVKRILKYLKGTINVDLQYSRTDSLNLIEYWDSDMESKLNRKNTSGGC